MDINESKKMISELANNLTKNDTRTFSSFEPFGKKMEAFENQVLQTVGKGTRTITRDGQDEDFTLLKFGPTVGEAKGVEMTIAFDARNIYVNDKSIRDIGKEVDVETGLQNLAKFKVDKVEFTGTYPWTRSAAAQKLGYLEAKIEDMTSADWTKLRKEYDSAPVMQGPGEGVDPIFEIAKVHITPVD